MYLEDSTPQGSLSCKDLHRIEVIGGVALPTMETRKFINNALRPNDGIGEFISPRF